MTIRSHHYLLLCLTVLCPFWSTAGEKMNLVFILADDLGWSDTTLYGTTSFYETPHIQRLAERGMLFTNAYTAHPLCSPTRASIMTGLEPGRIGFTGATGHVERVNLKAFLPTRGRADHKALTPQSVTRLHTDYITLAETLREAGYRTGHFGKWHLGREPYSPLEQGFEVDVPHWPGPGPAGSYVAPWKYPEELDFKPSTPDEHIEDRMAKEAVAFLEENRDRPFFLNYWAFSVHTPFDAKASLIEKYADKADPNNPQRVPLYAAMVESMDDAVGTLLDALDRLQLSQNTIVIFFSDNGGILFSLIDGVPPTSNAPLRGGKATIYEGGTRVPCAVIWPGQVQAGSKTDAFLTSTDWYPTILGMLSISKPSGLHFDGLNQVPTLKGLGQPRSDFTCFVPHYYPKSGNLPSTYHREGDWKLIRFHADGNNGADRFELYNLKEDIGETNDLSAAMPERVRRMNQKIDRYLEDIEAVVPIANPGYSN